MTDIVRAIREGDAVHPDVREALADYVESLWNNVPSTLFVRVKDAEAALRAALGIKEGS